MKTKFKLSMQLAALGIIAIIGFSTLPLSPKNVAALPVDDGSGGIVDDGSGAYVPPVDNVPLSSSLNSQPYADSVSCSGATLHGHISISGGSTNVWFDYWGPDGYTHSTAQQGPISSDQDFSAEISNLDSNATYSFRAMSTHSTGATLTFQTGSCGGNTPPANNANCPGNIAANLTGRVTSTSPNATGTVTNNSDCTYTVNIATYKMYSVSPASDWISSQKLFDYQTKTIGPRETVYLSASVPSCHYQIDVFQGSPVPASNPDFGGTAAFGHWLLDANYGGGNVCNDNPTPNQQPTSGVEGFLDTASCSAITGWAYGTNFSTVSVQLTDGVNSVNTTANQYRADVGADHPNAGNYHGYSLPTPEIFKDSSPHTISAFVIDSATGARIQLINSPKTIPACRQVVVNNPPQQCLQPGALNYGAYESCRFPNFTPTDVCPNIAGTQASVPAGMHIDGAGNCVDNYVPPNDVCPNIAGTQTSVPSGMHIDGAGNCVDNYVPPTDLCPNITGIQTTVPSGMHINSAGNCVVNTPNGVPPTVTLTADDTRIDYGDSTKLRWTVDNNADTCRASGDWSGSKNPADGTHTQSSGNLYEDSTFRITCSNQYGSDSDSVTVRVGDRTTSRVCTDRTATNYQDSYPCRYNTVEHTLPTVTLYAYPTTVSYNGSTTLNWTSTNASTCYASGGSTGWTGPKSIGPASFRTGSLTSGKTFTLTCSNSYGSANDSVFVSVRGLTTTGTTTRTTAYTPTSYVIINSSVDRNQPIVPTLDNTQPHPGDEINYTVTYQNVGNASISNLVLHLTLPYEVDYLTSNPVNPQIAGNNLTFMLGTLRANGTGTVTVRVRVREDAAPGALLNFPAVLSYLDPSGQPQSVSANVEAQVWTAPQNINYNQNITPQPEPVQLGAGVFGAGFFPSNLFGWLLLLILILVLIWLARYIFNGGQPYVRRISTTTVQH